MPHRIILCLIAFALPVAALAEEPSPDTPDVPLFQVNKRLHAAPEPAVEEGNAAVVELGDGPSLPAASIEDWTVPEEEAAPVPKAAPQAAAAIDPEFSARMTDFEEQPHTPKNAPRPHKTAVAHQPDDPEALSRLAALANEQDDPPHESAVPTAVALKKPVVTGDAPRYEAGVGLDSEAAEALAEMLAAAEKVATDPAATEKPPEAPKSAAAAKLAQMSDEMKTKVAAAAAAKKKAREKAGTDKKKPVGDVDPEKELNDLIAEIEAKNKLVAEAREKESSSQGGDVVMARDPRAARAIEALRNDKPLGTVTVRVMDANIAALVPARVRIVDSTDVSAEAPLSLGSWCDGALSAPVISGPVRIEISRGRFHPTYLKGVEAPANGNAACDAVVARARAMDFVSRGWYLADLNLSLTAQPGEQSVWLGKSPTLDDLALAARAESVNVIGVNVPDDADPKEFTESLERLSKNGLLLMPVFSGPRHGLYGSCMGLGLQNWTRMPREIVSPEKPLVDAMDDIRSRGGLAVYNTLFGTKSVDLKRDLLPLFPRLQESGNYAPGNSMRLYAAHELPFDTVINAYDVLAFDGSDEAEALWFNLLKQGYPVSVIGASGGSLEGGRPPIGQTFVKVDGPLSREAVTDAVRKGRTGVSCGPAVFAKIVERDMGPGSVLPADGRPLNLQVQAYATMRQSAQIEKIEIIRNGVVIQTHVKGDGEAQVPDFRCPISETSTAWYVVRVTERSGVNPVEIRRSRAWTSPIFFRGPSFAPPPVAQSRVTGVLRKGMTPSKGTVTAMVPGGDPIKVETDANGKYKIEAPASATLVFAVEGCEPYSVKIFSHPRVQRAIAGLQTGRDGTLAQQFAKPALFASWNLLVSDLEWDVALVPSTTSDK